jgi:hypothetical protein
MTPARFKQIAAAPGDSIPLNPNLSKIPFWAKSKISCSMEFQDGRRFEETCNVHSKSIDGRYVVSTVDSEFYKRPMQSILEYDEKAKAYKQWGLFDSTVTSALVIYDFEKGTSAATASFDPKYLELSVGSFSEDESVNRTQVYQDGVLVLTRNTKSWRVREAIDAQNRASEKPEPEKP